MTVSSTGPGETGDMDEMMKAVEETLGQGSGAAKKYTEVLDDIGDEDPLDPATLRKKRKAAAAEEEEEEEEEEEKATAEPGAAAKAKAKASPTATAKAKAKAEPTAMAKGKAKAKPKATAKGKARAEPKAGAKAAKNIYSNAWHGAKKAGKSHEEARKVAAEAVKVHKRGQDID